MQYIGWPAAARAGGTSYGETDDFGHTATVNRRHVRDLHATILHQMGLDPQRLTYF